MPYRRTISITHSDKRVGLDAGLGTLCFPTMKGQCGRIPLNAGEMRCVEKQDDRQNARLRYLSKILSQAT